jgi:hypothetical protein
MFSFLLPEEPGTLPEEEAAKQVKKRVSKPEHKDTRAARKASGVRLSGPQTSITVAFALIFAGILARRNWFQKFTTWIRS